MLRIGRSKFVAQAALVASGLISAAQNVVAAESFMGMGPVELNGHLGYYYRSYTEDGGSENLSHQLGGTINASTFFGEPWLATSYLSLSLTQDSSESSSTSSSTTSDSSLITGDLGLNILPQSKTPFRGRLQLTDSRVDTSGTGFTPITFVGEEYSTTYLSLHQAFVTDSAGRYEVNYDTRTWESSVSGEYDDVTMGLGVDVRKPRHHLNGRSNITTNEHAETSRENENFILDLSHFYYPLRDFRLDSKVSYYDYQRSFLDPNANDTRISEMNLMQLSSNAFWRPANYPLSVTAGVRFFVMDGSEGNNTGSEVDNFVVNSGLFYQVNQNLRLDASFNSLFGDVNGVEDSVHRQQAGFLYQTDWMQWRNFMYQAYFDGDFNHRADADDDITDLSLLAGHGLGRTWWPSERTSTTSLRLNFNQSLAARSSSGTELNQDLSGSGMRLDNSVTLAFNQRAWGGNSVAQITYLYSLDAYSEDVAGATQDEDLDQQLINLQLSRDQDLGRRSSLTGDISLQYVNIGRETDDGAAVVVEESDITTSTARVMFQHFHMFGIPRLQFASDLMISKTTTDGAIERQEWENRLSYLIGKLETNFSYRLTDTDSRNYDLLYFRLMRRF